MGEFRIGMPFRIPAWAPVSATSFPNLAGAVKMIAHAAHAQWSRYAAGAPLPNGKTIQDRTGAYLRSIQLRFDGAFSAEVYTDLPYAASIEYGSKPYDMKQILNTSLKVRVSAKGRRYLIIPFRHNTPGSVLGHAMPPAVHEWWKDKQASRITARMTRLSGTGAWDIKTRRPISVAAWRYRWGHRLGKDDLAGMGIQGPEAKRLEGMVMFRKPKGRGYGAHSQYITFRVMREGSPGWIRPAQDGKYPAKTTADQLRPIAEEAFRRAVELDIRGIVGG